MKQVFVRFAEPKDDAEFTAWVKAAQDINLFDPKVMTYPTTRTLVAHNGESLVYMPVQTTLTMESLAPRPGIAPIDEAIALREITKAVALLASQAGVREVYFPCKDERVVKFATNHGYEELGEWKDEKPPEPVPNKEGKWFWPWKTLRLKVGQ